MKISKEFKIGIVVVCALVAFIWGVNFLKGSNIFSKKNYLYALYPKIDGLIEASPILINGFKVGQVSEISLLRINDTNKVLVKFLITSDVQIPVKSTARSVSADLLGSKAVEIVFSSEKGYVKSGDTLFAALEPGFKQELDKRIAPIQAKAESLIGAMDSVINVVSSILNAKTRDNLDKSIEGVRKAILSLEQTAYKLDDLIGTEKAKISSILTNLNGVAADLNKSGDKIKNIISNLNNVSDSLAKAQLKSAIDEADKSLKQLNIMITKINQGEGTIGKLAKNDTLYYNLNKSTVDLDKLLKDLRVNPERYIHFSVFGRKEKRKDKPKD
ncbi:MAG: MCE family protein [Sphingobacteriaceae bacterium]|nr:MCE family protein [Sphingobacteriaceae bacterium]